MPVSPKKKLYEHFARVAKAMASPSRLELLEALAQGERSVDGLAKAVGISVANTSHHLQILRDGGVVKSRKDGLQVIYSLNDPEVPNILSGLRHVAERHLADVERIVRESFDHVDELKPVKRQELLRLVSAGETVVIDVRPANEYEAGHIAGAINIPLESLSEHLARLPKTLEVVAYCRGPYCMFAYEAVSQLRSKGFKARRLEEGYPEWKAGDFPVETD